jgi:hypothetical protein
MFVNLKDLSGTVYFVNPELVSTLTDAGTTPAGVYVDIQGDAPTRIVASGTVAAVAAALNAGLPVVDANSGEYAPTFSNFSLQVTGAVAPSRWGWHRIGHYVIVVGEALATLAPGPGVGTFEVDLPFPISPGTSANNVATMGAEPPTAAPEAPVSPFTTATTVGFTISVTGVYPTARVATAFIYQAQ